MLQTGEYLCKVAFALCSRYRRTVTVVIVKRDVIVTTVSIDPSDNPLFVVLELFYREQTAKL
jgi:hypothetical protein